MLSLCGVANGKQEGARIRTPDTKGSQARQGNNNSGQTRQGGQSGQSGTVRGSNSSKYGIVY